MSMVDRYPTFYPRCIRCRKIFTTAHLEQGKCHACHNEPKHRLFWTMIAVLFVVTVLLVGCSGYKEGVDVMEKYRAGNFRVVHGYYDYMETVEANLVK